MFKCGGVLFLIFFLGFVDVEEVEKCGVMVLVMQVCLNGKQFGEFVELFDSGVICVVIDSVYLLVQVSEVYVWVVCGYIQGKLVLQVC